MHDVGADKKGHLAKKPSAHNPRDELDGERLEGRRACGGHCSLAKPTRERAVVSDFLVSYYESIDTICSSKRRSRSL